MRVDPRSTRTLAWVMLFGIAFGFVESSVVVYLRALYYPEGFQFPLKLIQDRHLLTEVAREAATIVILVAVAAIAGSKTWERIGYFLAAFGVWDVFYYFWCKVLIDWPVTLADWDVLFLIPLPWIGPVIAPLLVALLMTVYGSILVVRVPAGEYFRPAFLSWSLFISATIILLYSFISDIAATTQGQSPASYRYELLIASLLLYSAGFVLACRKPASLLRDV
jgi:hypothetical protein